MRFLEVFFCYCGTATTNTSKKSAHRCIIIADRLWQRKLRRKSIMKNFYLSEKDSLSQLIKSLSPCNSDEEIHILLSDGEHKAAEQERIFYNFENPLIIESDSGTTENCYDLKRNGGCPKNMGQPL